MKRVFSAVITFALAITSLVALESPASAADNVGVYPLNINNASAPGNAKDFTTYNGKVYFNLQGLPKGSAKSTFLHEAPIRPCTFPPCMNLCVARSSAPPVTSTDPS